MAKLKEGPITKKKVSWKEDLTATLEIEGKVKVDKHMKEEVLSMIAVFKKFLPIQMKRTRFVELTNLITNYERNSKEKFNEHTFRTILSLERSSFQPVALDNKLYIDITDGNIIEDIMKAKIERLFSDCVPYIDLVPIQECKRKYQSAQEILRENIEKFSDDESEVDEEAANDKDLPIMERLSRKIKRRNDKERKRAMKMQAKKDEWQRERLPKLARIVDKIFRCEQKNLIKYEELLERIVQSEYRSMNIREDFKKLVKTTNGWLTNVNGFIKRRPEDMNHILCLIINH